MTANDKMMKLLQNKHATQYVWFAVDGDGSEFAFFSKPRRADSEYRFWELPRTQTGHDMSVHLEKGSIFVITGKNITFHDNPIEWRIDWNGLDNFIYGGLEAFLKA